MHFAHQTDSDRIFFFSKSLEPALNNSRDLLVDFVIRHPVLAALFSLSPSTYHLNRPQWLALPFQHIKHQTPTTNTVANECKRARDTDVSRAPR